MGRPVRFGCFWGQLRPIGPRFGRVRSHCGPKCALRRTERRWQIPKCHFGPDLRTEVAGFEDRTQCRPSPSSSGGSCSRVVRTDLACWTARSQIGPASRWCLHPVHPACSTSPYSSSFSAAVAWSTSGFSETSVPTACRIQTSGARRPSRHMRSISAPRLLPCMWRSTWKVISFPSG